MIPGSVEYARTSGIPPLSADFVLPLGEWLTNWQVEEYTYLIVRGTLNGSHSRNTKAFNYGTKSLRRLEENLIPSRE